MNKLLLILAILPGTFFLQAQNLKIESYWHQATDKKEKDTTRILALVEVALRLRNSFLDSSFHLAQQALSMSNAIGFIKGKGRALRIMGVYYRSAGDNVNSLIYSDSAIQFGKVAGDEKGIAAGQLNIGLIYQEQGKFQQALEYDFLALKGFEKIRDQRNIAAMYLNIGLVHYDQKNYKKALEYLKNASLIGEKVDDKSLTGLIYTNLGYVYQIQNDLENALAYQYKSLEILVQSGDYRTATYPYNSLAEICLIKHEFPRALQYLKTGLQIAEKANYQDRISDLSKTYAQYCYATQDYKRALEYASKAEALGHQNVELLRNANEQKYLAAYKLGDFHKALMSYQLFQTMKDSMQNETNKRNSLAQEFAFKEEKLELENLALVTESQLKERQLRVILIFFMVIVLLALVIGYLAFTYYRSFRKNKALKDQIQEKNAEIQTQSLELVESNGELSKLNEELQSKQEEITAQNEELQQSHEEISAQRDLVAAQNQELERVKIVIEKQNHEIKIRNFNLNEEVENRTRELLEYNQQLEQFAFVSSHNLRAPVARILGLGKLLELSGKNAADEVFITKSLITSTYELDRIVRDLNTILEIRKGGSSAISEIPLDEEMQMLLINLEKEISDTHATITWDFSQVPVIQTVRPYLDSIIINLLNNSIKYKHPDRAPRIHLKTELRSDSTCLIVRDNGLGIDLSIFGEKLFKLYSRFHLHVDGKGLGLHLVKTQVTTLGGKIEAESKVNEGIAFFIYFKNSRHDG